VREVLTKQYPSKWSPDTEVLGISEKIVLGTPTVANLNLEETQRGGVDLAPVLAH
jgi:hypothetical protein